MAINTFVDNGVSISVNPEYLHFNDNTSDIEKDDEVIEEFTISNNSGAARTFKFQLYSVASGFSVLDSDQVNHGGWNEIVVENGATETFYIKFNAWLFGTQTAYLTISADVDGYIRLPVRAQVSGAADFRVISTGYACSDENAPEIDYLDFYKVAYGASYTRGIKLCNTGGEDISIYSSTVYNGDGLYESISVTNNAFDDFLDTVSDEIESTFSFGTEPTTSGAFTEPSFIDYGETVSNPAGSFDASVYHSGDDVSDLLLSAGKILRLDIEYSPNLDAIASNDSSCSSTTCRYNPINMDAVLSIDTSLGAIDIPLVGSTGGVEPMLQMSYKLTGDDEWREIDLNSDSPAIYFGSVELFLDWVSNNSEIAEITIENIGSGSETLDFYGGSVEGYFEYYWEDEALSFPISLSSGASETFKIRYLPAATGDLDSDYETHWDFGHFYFDHTGGNGPNGKAYLVGEQSVDYAVEVYLGGTKLADGDNKHLCVFSTDASNPTQKTFTVYNNTSSDTMEVSWYIDSDDEFTSTPSSGTFELAPGTRSEDELTIDFVANADMIGSSVGGTLHIETNFQDKETEYADLITDLESRSYDIDFQATASESGESSLCGTGVLGDEGSHEVTFIMDRVTMVLADLNEPAHNPPPFKFHLPLELDRERGTVRISSEIGIQLDPNDMNPIKAIRSYVHQATNIRGCAPLPTNPYKLEFQKGSWTGEGIECADEGDGTIVYTSHDNEELKIDSDMACMPNNGGEVYTDTDGTEYTVVYHDFVKFDNCQVEYYGRISTFAYKHNEEGIADVFERAEENPNESESFYEEVYGAYRYDSEIVFLQDKTCNGISYGPTSGVQRITDPDEVKDCYLSLASNTQSVRKYGFLNECSYFVFTIEEGIEPDDADSSDPDYENWSGFGIYEPHVDDDLETHETKYDITIYNANMKAYVLSAGDRSIFFSHPGHLVYSDIYATITTKRVAEEDWYDGDWEKRISPATRMHVEKYQTYLVDGEWRDIKQFWTEEGHNSKFSNVIDDEAIEYPGINYGGYGRGNFRFMNGDPSSGEIIFAGWPVNFDENNLTLMVAMGSFQGKGNTAPSFAKADASTGVGKPLYFTFHGCLIPGEAQENQGCFDYTRDDGLMYSDADAGLLDESRPIIDEYEANGMLPDGYVDAEDCANLEDPGFIEFEAYTDNYYKYMACINFKIQPLDRDRYKNYYDGSQTFDYGDDPYKGDYCGYGN